MLQIPLLLMVMARSASVSLPVTIDRPEVREHYAGLYSVRIDGYDCQTLTGAMLPMKTVMYPVPLEGEVSVTVEPSGIASLGAAPPVAMSVFEGETEKFVEADISSLPSEWSEVVERGTFRRTGYVRVRLYPVIYSDGELLYADLSVNVQHEHRGAAETVRGFEGEILETVFGTSEVWREPVSRAGESPFWGKPWARIQVDTAGVFRITGEMIPEALGMPSGTFSMMTGRGAMISFEEPELDTFVPRPVPILVQDGGDGTFDAEDGIVFYGRGLSWWQGFTDGHTNSAFSHENTYWLTWGGEGGPFMEVLDGSVTGAPPVNDTYINRLHFEENQNLSPDFDVMDDGYAWHRIASSTPAYYSFQTPGAAGGGTIRVRFYIDEGNLITVTARLNDAFAADTVVRFGSTIEWEFPVNEFSSSGNTLSLQFESSGHKVYTEWFEVFPETGYRSWSSVCQVPLDRQFPAGERRLVTWAQNLGSSSFVCMVLSDTAAVAIDVPGGKDFEVPMPEDWTEPVMWVLPGGAFLEPVSVSSASPGRIVETLNSARTVYIFPEEFADDMPLFARGRNDVEMIALQEIYDEFNGGVRDPNAVRAFFIHTLRYWDQIPSQLVLAGDGHWDPRGFTTGKSCPVDILTYSYHDGTPVCSDHLYASPVSTDLPQAAVSRIPASSRTELQLVAGKSAAYADPTQESGTWQSVVIGAADDERYPTTPDSDQTDHTEYSEEVMTEHVPERLVPLRHYEIFWDWNSNWKKPECRAAFIENWSEGAVALFYMGHGGFDQLADEGLMYLEDTESMACGKRTPYAFFGSCSVGFFQNPSNESIAEEVVTSQAGGAIVSSGASCVSQSGPNRGLLQSIFDVLLYTDIYGIGEAQWLGMLNHGTWPSNDKQYIIFGDGSLELALPDSGVAFSETDLFTSQLAEVDGNLNREGLVMVTAWESARPDSYYTRAQSLLIEYLSTPGIYYRGLAPADPEFELEMFVPEVAVTGKLARIRYFSPGEGGGELICAYPLELDYGVSGSSDTIGPDIEMWLSGFRGVENPTVSGSIVLEAILSDESGINLLPYPGNQLALYIDGTPIDVADWFTYQPGSATTGTLVYPVQELQPGDHHLKLRVADNLTNLSTEEMTFHLLEESSAEFTDFFVYPTPAISVVSFNWVQSSPAPVTIGIYTVSGRKIREMGNLAGFSGYNQQTWDLTDEEGDRVASGSYIFVVSAGDSRETGILTVAR